MIAGTLLIALCSLIFEPSHALKPASRIETNAAYIYNAPKWLKRNRAEKTIRRVQRDLEWSIRRIPVHFHLTAESFTKSHKLGPYVSAVTIKHPTKTSVELGPLVTDNNFDQIFAHELVHVIAYQKYKNAIPKWLEEGLANHLAKKQAVDYQWLGQQTLPDNVTEELVHPLGKSQSQAIFRYRASQAFAEMLSQKCDLTNLLRLSVERKMESYIKTYCEIPDINAAFKKWVLHKSKKN